MPAASVPSARGAILTAIRGQKPLLSQRFPHTNSQDDRLTGPLRLLRRDRDLADAPTAARRDQEQSEAFMWH
jgi:hypothetical protein